MKKSEAGNRSRTWLRFSGLLLGIITLVWLLVEESSNLGVLVIAGLVCTWGGIWLLLKVDADAISKVWIHLIIGGGAGLLLAPLAILLMALKTGLHGHATPDFTLFQMQLVLSRTPFFTLAGILLGAGGGLLRYAIDNRSLEGV